MSDALTGAEFKQQLREGMPKLGLFLNSHSPTVAEQLAHSGYDWGAIRPPVPPPRLRTVRHARPRAVPLSDRSARAG